MKSIPITLIMGNFFKDGVEYKYKGAANTRFICENVATGAEVQISAYDTVQIKDEDAESYVRCIKDNLSRMWSNLQESERALMMLGEKRAKFDDGAVRAIESFIAGIRDALYFKLEEEAIKGSGRVTYDDAKKLIDEQVNPKTLP
jgi:hypothetical protein